jgi:SAM-dependent methyltransferase
MDTELYPGLYEAENNGWWSVSRRKMVIKFLQRLSNMPDMPLILDFGCGTGKMLEDLKKIALVHGCDNNDAAIEFCKLRGLQNITKIRDASTPYPDNYFDVILAMDVIEHIENDLDVIKELKRILKPGGYLFITVPAFMTLWTSRDERLHHYRRYDKNELIKKLMAAGVDLKKCSYMHLFYFFPLLFFYKYISFFRSKESIPDIKTDYSILPKIINLIFIKILDIESYLLRYINFPFGVSLFSISQKV